jgi:TonB-dependent receptor
MPPSRLTRPPSRRITSLALALVASVAFSTHVAAQTGQITGRATQAESGRPLLGAQIQVSGTSIRTTTGEGGRFLILRVPEGQQTLELTYLGREAETRTITVVAGQLVNVDFSVAVAPLAIQGIEVLGTRAMTQARALSEQQNAANIINVVASDQIGRFPDASAPEALQRIPGITVERDMGEGRYINIRGANSDFTAVNLNGSIAPSPEGDARRVALDAVPVDILESIEVAKAITPDMDAQGIGGAVNLVTRKAPQTTVASLDLGSGYAPIRGQPSYEGVLTLGGRFGEDDRFGALFLGSYGFRDFGSDDIEPSWDFGDPGLADDVLEEFQTRYYSLTRQRIGTTASLDYRLSETSGLQFTGTYTEHEDTEQRRRMIHLIEDGELEFTHKNRREKLQIASGRLEGNHLFSGVQFDWGASYGRAGEDTPYDSEIVFLQEGVSYSPDIRDPTRVRPNPMAGAYDGTFLFDVIEPASSKTTDADLGAFFDLEVPYRLRGTATGGLKFGLNVRDKTKDQNLEELAYELASGSLSLADIGRRFDIDNFVPGDEYGFVPVSTTPEQVRDFVSERRGQLAEERDIEAETENFDLSERVVAGYVLTELNLSDKLMILPGVRYEYTDYQGDGFEFDPDTETLSPVRSENTYGNIFPHLHMRYRVTPRTNLRAAYSSAIARPNYFDLIPYRIRDDEDRELGNPDLDPTTANSFDLLVEHYDQRIGVLSAGVFYKFLTDPIYTFIVGNELGGDDEQPRNGESAEVRGFEVAVQQQLRFLPGALSGLGFYGNYTWTDSEATLADGRVAGFAGQARHAFNAALSYEWAGFSGQASLNFRDAYVDGYGEEEAEDEFVGSRHQVDLSASYRLSQQGTVYLELVNLTDQPFLLYQGFEVRELQREYYRPSGTIGVRFTL